MGCNSRAMDGLRLHEGIDERPFYLGPHSNLLKVHSHRLLRVFVRYMEVTTKCGNKFRTMRTVKVVYRMQTTSPEGRALAYTRRQTRQWTAATETRESHGAKKIQAQIALHQIHLVVSSLVCGITWKVGSAAFSTRNRTRPT